jgi:hypothetical protein
MQGKPAVDSDWEVPGGTKGQKPTGIPSQNTMDGLATSPGKGELHCGQSARPAAWSPRSLTRGSANSFSKNEIVFAIKKYSFLCF